MAGDKKTITHRKLKNQIRSAIKSGDASHTWVLQDTQQQVGEYLFERFKEQVLESESKRKGKK